MDGMEFLTGENKLDTGITIKGAEDFVRAAKLIQDAVRRWDEIVTAHIEAMDSALTRFDLMVTRMETMDAAYDVPEMQDESTSRG